jgi:23S rRNA-/tRNA-specific pseudouridylate synthase
LTTVNLFPQTGRTHQLRRHCAYQLQCPILGDTRYGAADATASKDTGASDDGAADSLDQTTVEPSSGCASAPELVPLAAGQRSGSGLFLAAVEVALAHPVSGLQMRWRIDEPPKFEALRQREQARYDRLAHQAPVP